MKTVTRWQLPELANWPGFGGLSGLREEMGHLFGAPWAELTRSAQNSNGWIPAFDIFEDKDNLYVKAELPGMKKEEINISFQDGCLSISGERKGDEKFKDAEVYRTESFSGSFQRTVTLPAEVAVDQIKANYKDGVLTVTLPKKEEAKPKQISVTVN